MASITAAGSGSGLDIDSIVKGLTDAERKLTDKRNTARETELKANISAYDAFKASLTDLQKGLSGLTTMREVSARTATSDAPTVFTASAGTAAALASADIQVEQLAQSHKLTSGGFANPGTVVGTGKMTLSMNGKSFSIDIKNAENDSLTKIRDSINSAANNPGIKATILTVADPDNPGSTQAKLMLTSEKTGAANAITIDVEDDDGNNTDKSGLSQLVYKPGVAENLSQVTAAQDAKIFVDGFAATSSTNTFSGVIEGVSITAVSADPGKSHSLNVSVDKGALKTKIQAFAATYNTYLKGYHYLTDYDTSKKEGGLLTGDSLARSVANAFNRTLSTANTKDTGDFKALADIGITRSRTGEITVDDTKLSAALDSDFDAVANLVAGDNGVLKSFNKAIDDVTGVDGSIAKREKTVNGQLDDLHKQMDNFETRMTAFTDRIRKQFTNMDIIVAQFKNTGDFLTQQLNASTSSKK